MAFLLYNIIVMIIFLQTVLAVLVIVFVLLQSRGAGIGSVWGGGGEFYGTRRGIEKVLFRITILVTVLFTLVSLASGVLF